MSANICHHEFKHGIATGNFEGLDNKLKRSENAESSIVSAGSG